MSEDLIYRAGNLERPMIAEPVNVPLWKMARILVEGRPVVAILEPGDATRYTLLITPVWAGEVREHLGSLGILEDSAAEYLHISKLDDLGGNESWFAAPRTGSWDLEYVRNEWSREFLSWWSRQLWEKIQEV